MQKAFVANKALLVNPTGKVLVLRDAGHGDHDNSKEKWDFPGGRMNKGEHPVEGLKREVEEETGVVIDTRKIKLFYTDKWGLRGDAENEPIIGLFYIVEVDNVKVELSSEHEEFRWMDPRLPLPEEMEASIGPVMEAFRNVESIVVGGDPDIRGREGLGLIHVITGNGKGKTTSSLGLTLRAVGAGLRVGIVFFDKGGTGHYSERIALAKLFKNKVDYVATGRDRIDPETGRFDFSITDKDGKEALRGLKAARHMMNSGQFDVLIFDEINSTTSLGMLGEKDVLDMLREKPSTVEVILTGRNAPESFLRAAHLVTDMKLRKHYFYSGVPARPGIDF